MRELVITNRAKIKIATVFEYIEIKFGIISRKKFANKLAKSIKVAHMNPEIFPVSKHNKRVRKCVVSKQSTIYYTFDTKNVVILSLFDTRQKPL